VKIMTAVGKWMDRNGHTVYESDRCQPRRSNYASFTRKGNTLYMHVHFWPGETVAISGLRTKVKSAKLLATGKSVEVKQDDFRTLMTGLPQKAPDDPITTIALECDAEPKQDTDYVRKNRARNQA
jgi:alpha-L-fucosidase